MLTLDDNLIYDPTVVVDYIIQGVNVPLKYLGLRGNRLSEVDKIRMAKLMVSEVKDRALLEETTIVELGQISVVDEEVLKYVEMLNYKNTEIMVNLEQKSGRRAVTRLKGFMLDDYRKSSQPSPLDVQLSLNREWELCDQEGILLASNFQKRRKTSARRSQIIKSILINNSFLGRSEDMGGLDLDRDV